MYQTEVEQIIPELITAPLLQIDQITELVSHGIDLKHISNADYATNLTKLVEMCEHQLPKYQEFVHHLQLIEYVSGQLCQELLNGQFLGQLAKLNTLVRCPLSGVRSLVCRSMAAICEQEIGPAMNLMLEYLVDLMDNNEFDLFARQGYYLIRIISFIIICSFSLKNLILNLINLTHD